MLSLSGTTNAVAGKTGLSVGDNIFSFQECPATSIADKEPITTYSVEFVKGVSESALTPTLQKAEPSRFSPPKEFSLKQQAKRGSRFTQAQKDIMIMFYNRQLLLKIKANPKDVMETMKANDLPVLTETQIKSWWSTYHQKRKSQMEQLNEETVELQRLESLNSPNQEKPLHGMTSQPNLQEQPVIPSPSRTCSPLDAQSLCGERSNPSDPHRYIHW